MGYKKTETNLSFADVSLFASLEHNRAIKRMGQISSIVNWTLIERPVVRDYPIGKSSEGTDAYHPLLLLKCLLLQQWFRIDSDPESETQINDRISFKKFLGLPMDQPSPDHSTFSRFRSRLSMKPMKVINHELLSQFAPGDYPSMKALPSKPAWYSRPDSHAHRARFTRLVMNAMDALFRQLAFNLFKGTKVLA